jgi:hypothetical protein
MARRAGRLTASCVPAVTALGGPGVERAVTLTRAAGGATTRTRPGSLADIAAKAHNRAHSSQTVNVSRKDSSPGPSVGAAI